MEELEIYQMLCPAGLKSNPNKNLKSIDYITIHCTGNYSITGTAFNHAKLQYSGNSGNSASWHYTVDAEEIWQSYEDYRSCWHAGDGTNGPGNSTSIAIEICVNDKERFDISCYNAANLTAELLKKYNLSFERIVQHYHWNKKNCPAELRSGAWGITWENFVDMTKSFFIEKTTPILASPSASLEQALKWAKANNATETYVSLAEKYFSLSGEINPIMAYCQAAYETSFGHFKDKSDENHHNPCGLYNKDGSSYMFFNTWEEGIKAHIDHLGLYAGGLGYPKGDTSDPRHFPYLFGTAKTVESLSYNWSPSATYGGEIVSLMKRLEATEIEPKQISHEEMLEILIEDSSINTPEYWFDALKTFKYFDGFVEAMFEKYENVTL